jgi:hypothetical protein
MYNSKPLFPLDHRYYRIIGIALLLVVLLYTLSDKHMLGLLRGATGASGMPEPQHMVLPQPLQPSLPVTKTSFGVPFEEEKLMPDNSRWRKEQADKIIQGILALRDPATKLLPSHVGHPGYGRLGFLYDNMAVALVLNAAGKKREAEQILDYFVARLRIPSQLIEENADTNNVYGITKIYRSEDTAKRTGKGLINAFDYTSADYKGQGMLEYVLAPGPTSFVIFALLQVNEKKYAHDAEGLARLVLSMQDSEGGIGDGDREPDKIHTEPHMDGFDAFTMMFAVTGEPVWKQASDKAFRWFSTHVFHPQTGMIDQGLWEGRPHRVFAEDCYAWTMAGAAGDRLDIPTLTRVTDYWLRHCLTKTTVKLPDGNTRTLVLVDFTDPLSPECMENRGGRHAMGSIEWTGGAILALQKNAARCWQSGNTDSAKFYKALAEILLDESLNAFYYIQTPKKAFVSFYATGQGVGVGQFGSISCGDPAGWKTPFWYTAKENGASIKGGSLIAAWPLLPLFGNNPFIIHDPYKETYDRIPYTEKHYEQAKAFMAEVTAPRSFTETLSPDSPDPEKQLVEPQYFIHAMWDRFIKAQEAQKAENTEQAGRYYKEVIYWASRVVNDEKWLRLACRDNELKRQEIKGILYYPWGQTFPCNKCKVNDMVYRYPLLNEMGVAMWGLAVSNAELGRRNNAKYWIGRIIDEVPLHQIAAMYNDPDTGASTELICGYWNALEAWEDNPGGNALDESLGELYREVLAERNLTTAKPAVVTFPDGTYN